MEGTSRVYIIRVHRKQNLLNHTTPYINTHIDGTRKWILPNTQFGIFGRHQKEKKKKKNDAMINNIMTLHPDPSYTM